MPLPFLVPLSSLSFATLERVCAPRYPSACGVLAPFAPRRPAELAAGSTRGNAEANAALKAQLQAAMSSGGQSLLRALLSGLADSLPPAAVPRVADVLAPLLATPSWQPSLRQWTAEALGAIPVTDGVPDAATCELLLREVCSLPDPFGGGGLDMGIVERLRLALCEFARVCRRMESAAPFDVAAYQWKAM